MVCELLGRECPAAAVGYRADVLALAIVDVCERPGRCMHAAEELSLAHAVVPACG